jgi:2-C-methyl-D-erythritol 4-phosphate cytidylyltransferase
VLIYTLESFERHPQIDAIEVVCIDGWHDVLRAYAKQFNITNSNFPHHQHCSYETSKRISGK